MPQKILILCSMDKFANGVYARETERVLRAKGYEVKLLHSSRSWLSACLDNIRWLDRRIPKSIKVWGYYTTLKRPVKDLEARIIRERPDAVICLISAHAYVLTRDLKCLKIFSCPTPFVDELYFGGNFNESLYRKLRQLELEIYEKTDYLSFH